MQLQEALQFAILFGNKSKQVKKRISARMWPNSSEKTREVNVSNLFRGDTKTYSEETIKILSEEMGVSPNFIFNYNEKTKTFES